MSVWCSAMQLGRLQTCSGHVRRTLFYLNQQVSPNENFGQEPIAQSYPCVAIVANGTFPARELPRALCASVEEKP